MEKILVDVQNVSLTMPFRQTSKIILDNVSLSLARGKITTIIGPNGAGKTTLLKILLGFIQPTLGQVIRQSSLSIGYMPQKITLSSLLPLTVQRFLELTSPKSNRSLHQKIDQCLEEVGAISLKKQQVTHLSGGELQRVMLARTLIAEPDLLVLDEPAQGIDVLGQADLYRLIAQIRDQHHCGIVLVSHDLHVVMSASDDVLCLNTHVCCSGHPEFIQKDPQYLQLFGERLGNLAPYTHHHDHRHDDSCSLDKHHD